MAMSPKSRKRQGDETRGLPPPPRRAEELIELLHGLDRTRDQERKQLSRELHDTLVGTLSATKLECDWLLRSPNATEAESKRRLANVSRSLADAILFARRVIDQLWPTVIQHLGLVAAIRHHVSELRSRSGLDVRVDTEGDVDALPELHALTLYRVVQETLELSSRQEPRRQVQVTLRRNREGVELRIAQDGAADWLQREAARFDGLLMRERVLRLGGELLLANESKGEVCLRLFLPLPPAQPMLVA